MRRKARAGPLHMPPPLQSPAPHTLMPFPAPAAMCCRRGGIDRPRAAGVRPPHPQGKTLMTRCTQTKKAAACSIELSAALENVPRTLLVQTETVWALHRTVCSGCGVHVAVQRLRPFPACLCCCRRLRPSCLRASTPSTLTPSRLLPTASFTTR